MASGGQITIDFAANLARLEQDVRKATRMVEGFGTTVKRSLMGAFAGISSYGLVNMARQTLEHVDALEEMAQKAGIAATEMMGLTAVAKLGGTEIGTLAKGFKFLSSNIVEAQQGSTDASQALRTLGTQAEDTAAAHSQLMERFLQVADKVSRMEDGYVKTAYVTKVFGKSGMDLIPILNKGRDSLEGMLQKAREWGVVLDQESIDKIARFNDALDEMSLRSQGAKNQIMAGMVDGLNRLADAYDEIISKNGFWRDLGEFLQDIAYGFTDLSIAGKALTESLAVGFSGLWDVIRGQKAFSELRAELDAVDKKWIKFREDIFTRTYEAPKRRAEKFFTPPKASDIDKIQGVIDKLRIEEAQLGKTAREQAVYNSLKEAGFKIDEATGLFKGDENRIRQITELTERIFAQKEALKALEAVNQRSVDLMKASQTEAAGWSDQLEDLRDLVNSGKITWEAYSIAVSKVTAEMARLAAAADLTGIEKMKSVIAALEIQDETPAVRIAQMKARALQEELAVRERLLAAMPRLTAEQQTAWNSEAEALDRVRQQLLEQEQIIRRYGDLWAGVRQGLKSYYDDAAAMADQVKKTVEDAFKGMEDALVEFCQTGKLSFRDLVNSIEADLIRLAVRQAITGPLSQGMGNAMSAGGGGFDLFSLFGGQSGMFFHAGGTVGRDGVPGRIPRGYFPGAPRYHGGLAPDEVPAILQKGETVIPKGRGGMLTQYVTMNISTPDAQSFRASQDQILRRAGRGMRRAML